MARILVVDDVDLVRRTLCRFLESAGHEAVAVTSAAEALARLPQAPPVALVVTDLWMPGETGVAVIRAAQERRPAVPVIAVTGGTPGAAEDHSQETARAAGAAEVLFKPLTRQILVEAVDRLVGSAGRARS